MSIPVPAPIPRLGISMFRFRDRFRVLHSPSIDSETGSETRLEPRVSEFRFRDERTGNLCLVILRYFMLQEICTTHIMYHLSITSNFIHLDSLLSIQNNMNSKNCMANKIYAQHLCVIKVFLKVNVFRALHI